MKKSKNDLIIELEKKIKECEDLARKLSFLHDYLKEAEIHLNRASSLLYFYKLDEDIHHDKKD